MKTINLISVLVGGYVAVLFGVACINAREGMQWAIDLLANSYYVLGVTGLMGLSIAVCVFLSALQIAKGK